jgi:hypothetical protein
MIRIIDRIGPVIAGGLSKEHLAMHIRRKENLIE